MSIMGRYLMQMQIPRGGSRCKECPRDRITITIRYFTTLNRNGASATVEKYFLLMLATRSMTFEDQLAQ